MRYRTLSILVALGLGVLGASCGSDNPSGPSDAMTIRILSNAGNMSFSPEVATVRVGQTVRFANVDSQTHAMVSDTAGVFSVGEVAPGQQGGSFALSAVGTVAYHCTIHPGMVGSIVVTN